MMRDLFPILHQEANPLSRKALARLPASHVFAIRHNRILLMLFQKLVYWIFKARNRLEVLGFEHVRAEMDKGGAFMIVANHSGTADVALQQAIQAHHDNITFTFINGDGFINQELYSLAAVLYFAEYIPRMGTGQQSIARTVRRLVAGDRIVYYPEGSFDFGLVWDGYNGVARIAHEYKKATGKPLRFVPSCAIGMHDAYNPHVHPHHHHHLFQKHKQRAHRNRLRAWLPRRAFIRRPAQQVKVKFGPAFTINLPANPTREQLEASTSNLMLMIAALWGQKKLRPNMSRAWIGRVLPTVDGQRVYNG